MMEGLQGGGWNYACGGGSVGERLPWGDGRVCKDRILFP